MNEDDNKTTIRIADRIWLILNIVQNLVWKARDKEVEKHGASITQVGVMFAVEGLGNSATPAGISRWTFREPHSISNIVQRMVAKGLLTKRADKQRRNLVKVSLTEKGREILDRAKERESVSRIFRVLSKQQQHQLWSLLLPLLDSALDESGLTDTVPMLLLKQARGEDA